MAELTAHTCKAHFEHSDSTGTGSPAESPGQRYWILPHVCACPTVAGTVLLDLKRNRYFGIDTKATRALFALDRNWSRANAKVRSLLEPMPLDEATRVADKLVDAGFLSREAPVEGAFVPSTIDLDGMLTSVGHQISRSTSLRFGHVIHFFRAYAWAHRAIRSRTLYSVACEVSSRKLHAAKDFDAQRAIELVCIFRRLRPFAFTAQDRCLFHALALVKFLAAYEVFPTWVIGVRYRPWAAHSWVQAGNLLLDSNPEHVCEYAPILTI